MSRIKFLCCLVLLISAPIMYGQQADYEKSMATPNTAELGKYGAIPVSKYTGIPNISIPFYEMNFNGLKIPVGITYHSGGGIKPMQESTWVGLGWSLTTNAVITRQIVQKSDINSINQQDHKGYVYQDPMPSSFTNEFLNYLNNGNGTIDTEPDIFFINIFGETSKFLLTKKADNGGLIGIKKLDESNNTIIYNESNGADDSFTVINSQGFIFTFGSKEYASNVVSHLTVASTVPQEDEYTTHGSSDLKKNTLAWYLDNIKAPNGQILEFNYLPGNHVSLSQSTLSETAYNSTSFVQGSNGSGSAPPPLVSNEHTFISQKSIQTNKYLKEIVDVTTGNKIIFETSNRDDIFNDTASQSYVDYLYEASTRKDPKKLNKIIIEDRHQNIIKEIEFANDNYFDSEKINHVKKESYLRLKLDGILIDNIQEYSFDYILPNSLPKKTTKNIDYWGYYNGANNTHRYPAYSQAYYEGGTQKFVEFLGGDRRSNFAYGRIGLLNKITYPTKGYTELLYESHTANIEIDPYTLNEIPDKTYSYIVGSNGNADLNLRSDHWLMEGENFEYSPPSGVEFGQTTLNFDDFHQFRVDNLYAAPGDTKTKTLRIYNKESPSIYSDFIFNCEMIGSEMFFEPANSSYGTITFYEGETYVFEDRTSPLSEYGSESWSMYFSIHLQNKSLLPPPNVDGTVTSDIGGARIQRIINKNHDGVNLKIKEFQYEDEFGGSKGRLMNSLAYLAEKTVNTPYYTVYGYQISSNSVVGIDNSAQGSHIGYDVVDEIEISTDDPLEQNGFTRTIYHNVSNIFASVINGPPIQQYMKNGKPKAEQFFAKGTGLNRVIDYDYQEKIIEGETHAFMIRYDPYGVRENYLYYLKSEYFPLVRKTTTDFFADNDELVMTETFDYNDKQLLKYHTISTSNSDISKKYYHYYPFDAYLDPEPFMDDLVQKNIIQEPILTEEYLMDTETMHYINSKSMSTTRLIKKSKTTFSDFGVVGGMILPETLQTSKGNTLVDKVQFYQYYTNGNPLEVSKEDGPHAVYLWGYNDRYPIAKIENATAAEVNVELGTLSNVNETDLLLINGLRSSLPNAMVTTFEYKPLIGVTKITDPKGLETTYQYDDLNRLEFVKDYEDNLLKEHQYKFRLP